MANEEIIVRFGGDLGPLSTALRGAKGMVKEVAAEVSNMVMQFGTAFMGAQLLSGIKKIISDFKEIQDRADNLSISTDFLQGMQHISSKDAVGGVETFNKAIGELSVKLGEAKGGGEEAIKKFEKWGITLRDIQDMDTEDMFYRIADRIKEIQDPTLRSAAAFELLGKAGKNLTGILQEGAASIKEVVDQTDKLSKADIQTLSNAKGFMDDLGNGLEVTLAKALVWATDRLPRALNEALGKVFGYDGRDPEQVLAGADAIKRVTSDPDTDPNGDAKLAKKKWDTKFSESDSKGQLKMLKDAGTQLALQRMFAGTQSARDDLDDQIVDNNHKIVETEKKIGEEKQKNLDKQKELNKEVAETKNKLSKLHNEASNENAQYGTVQEVANSGAWMRRRGSGRMFFQQGPLAQEGQQLLSLQAQEHRQRLAGNKTGAEETKSKADSIRADLEAKGAIEPTITEHLQSIKDSTALSQTHLDELNKAIKELKKSQE